MHISVFLIYLILTCLLFSSFTLVISIFGGIFLFFYAQNSKKDFKLSKIEYIIITYGIGISFFLMLSYITDIFQLYNFFTVYLPIIVGDIIFLGFFYVKKKGKNRILKSKSKIGKNSNLKIILFSIFILSIIFLFQIQRILPNLVKNSSLLSIDPYLWTRSVFHLIENQVTTKHAFSPDYPPGFTFFCAGNLLIYPDLTMAYFFMKFGFFPLFSFYIIIMFVISRRIFQKNYMIYITLIGLITYNFLLQRGIMFLSSIVANFFILIGILIYLTRVPNFFIGFIIASTYLVHSLSCLFLLAILFGFYFIQSLRYIKNKNKIIKIAKEIGFLFLVISFILIPYFLHAYFVYGWDLIELILNTIDNTGLKVRKINAIVKNNYLSIIQFSQLPKNIEEILSLGRLFQLYEKRTFGFFLIFTFGGLFLTKKSIKRLRINYDVLIQLKLGFVLVLVIFYLPVLLKIEQLINLEFYDFGSYRIIETCAPYVILLSMLSLNSLIEGFIKVWKSTGFKNKKIKKVSRKLQNYNLNVNMKSIVIFLFITLSTIFYFQRDRYYIQYHYDSYFSDNIIYINGEIPEDKTIAIPDFETDKNDISGNSIYHLLIRYNIIFYNLSLNITYKFMYNFSKNNNVDYVVLKQRNYNKTTWKEFYVEFLTLERDWIYGIYKFKEK